MESNENAQAELVTFFKTLCDENRLKIIGVLAQQAHSMEELVSILDLKPVLVSHHLSKLTEAGLVRACTQSGCRVYELHTDALHAMSKRLLAEEPRPNAVAELTEDAFDRKVMVDFLGRDGRLKAIPAQQRKYNVVLRRILAEFQVGERYSEKQVNAIVKRFHDDTATLRRGLVDLGWFKGEAGIYWREE
jgi:hypothetical protein